jgi:hypothetical protein
MPTVRGALIGNPSPPRPPGPPVASVKAENSRETNTTTPRSDGRNHRATLTNRSITSRMQMPCNKNCGKAGRGGDASGRSKCLTTLGRPRFQRRAVASGNNVAWKRDEQGWRMQRSATQFRFEVVPGDRCYVVVASVSLAPRTWLLAPWGSGKPFQLTA